MMAKRFATLLLLPLGLMACSDDEELDEPACGEPADSFVVKASAEAHTCDHVTAGPFGDLTAVGMSEADPPLLENQHMFYTVTLPEDGGSHAGSVTFRPPFNGTYSFSLTDDVPITVTALDDGSGTCNAASQTLDNCADLSNVHLFTIDGKRSYRVDIGPTDLETVGVVAEEHIIGLE